MNQIDIGKAEVACFIPWGVPFILQSRVPPGVVQDRAWHSCSWCPVTVHLPNLTLPISSLPPPQQQLMMHYIISTALGKKVSQAILPLPTPTLTPPPLRS